MATISQGLGSPDGILEYQYEPLIAADAVRVLVVHPADRLEDPLRCSIVQYVHSTELSSDDYCSHRHYSAVSYTWGSALPSRQLLIDRPLVLRTSGASSPAYLKITANVDSLLRHLRKSHKAIHTWVDAVCLNQMDKEEKAQQIPRMGDIYRAAKKVHIWLGDDNIGDARRAFSIIRQVEFRNKWDPSQDEVSLLAKFFGRAWFTRRWIVQEAVLAHEAILYCGSDSLALSWVVMALKKAQHSNARLLDALGYGPKMLLSSVGRYQRAPTRCNMLTLLWDLHHSGCSDPRDRVAALYGLASVTKRPPDLRYIEGATQLYWDCASYFANRDPMSAHMLILHLAEFGSLRASPQAGEPPSWVPDWSRSRRPSPRCIDGLQDVVEPLHERTLNRLRYPDPSFVDYCSKFIHAMHLQTSANGNILRISSHPLVFPVHGGIVDEVYRCESSDWKDVVSLLDRMFRELPPGAGNDYYHWQRLEEMLAAAHKDMWGKELLLTNTVELVLSCAQSLSPSQKDIECFEGIGSVLSRFSLIRTRPKWDPPSLAGDPTGRSYLLCQLGPRNAAVGDYVVPFIMPSRESQTSRNFWSVAVCLRPASKESTETYLERESPVWQTVRWVGAIFQNDWQWSGHGYVMEEGWDSQLGCIAYRTASRTGLPGPYVFDVI